MLSSHKVENVFREEEAETTVVDWGWVRDGGGSVQGTRGGGEEKWLNSEYILNTEPTGIADGFDVRGKRERNQHQLLHFCLECVGGCVLWFRWRTWGRTDARGEGRESHPGHVSLGMTDSHPNGNGVPVKKSVESSGLGGGGM